jgi:hypothetical protein
MRDRVVRVLRWSHERSKSTRRSRLAGAGVAAALIACLFLATPAGHDPPRTKVTWNGDIARIVNARCIRCHSPDGKGPMSLVAYEDARPWAKAIREEVMARRMPKWHAARGYGQFANDPSLSPFEISLFVGWVDGGALRGAEPAKIDTAKAATLASPVTPLRQTTLPCSAGRLPVGKLHAITPKLEEDTSAGFLVALPDGRREILAWIRNYEADFEETYWLQKPLNLPSGSRLVVEKAMAPCSLTLHLGS